MLSVCTYSIWMYTFSYVYWQIYMSLYVYVYMSVYIYPYMYAHKHILHTCRHTCVCMHMYSHDVEFHLFLFGEVIKTNTKRKMLGCLTLLYREILPTS